MLGGFRGFCYSKSCVKALRVLTVGLGRTNKGFKGLGGLGFKGLVCRGGLGLCPETLNPLN